MKKPAIALLLPMQIMGAHLCFALLPIIVNGASVAVTPGADTAEAFSIAQINMLNLTNGWAWTGADGSQLLLRTSDGGQTWNDVTPRGFQFVQNGSWFLDPKTAWVSTFSITNSSDGFSSASGLLRTTDGGRSWSVMLKQGTAPYGHFAEGASCRFLDHNHGVGKTADLGLGSAYVRYFDTHDGGQTWNLVNIIAPGGSESNLPSGTIHLCNVCGGGINFYPPSKIIITQGDLADEQAKGEVTITLTDDRGKSWRDVTVSIPSPYRDGLSDPFVPTFFDNRNALFPVHVVKHGTERARAYSVLIFYTSHDGGNTWAQSPGIVEHMGGYTEGILERQIDVVSMRTVFVRTGSVLQVTTDGAQSWRTVHPDIDIGREDSKRDMTQMHFVNTSHGWTVINDRVKDSPVSHYTLYRTSDGGKTWVELPVRIAR